MKACPKCGYARTAADRAVPDWQCPKCGIAYAKFDEQQSTSREAKRPVPAVTASPASSPISATALFFILAGLVALGFAGYKKFYGPEEASSGPSLAQIVSASGPPPEALVMSPEALSALAQITPSKVVLFSTAWCGYCAKVKQLLHNQGVRFTELDIEQEPRYAEFQKQNMRVIGFPVLVVGSRIVGGYDERAILAALKAL